MEDLPAPGYNWHAISMFQYFFFYLFFPFYPDFIVGFIGITAILISLITLFFLRKKKTIKVQWIKWALRLLIISYVFTVSTAQIDRGNVVVHTGPFLGEQVHSKGFPAIVFTYDAGMTDPRVHKDAILLNYLFFVLLVGVPGFLLPPGGFVPRGYFVRAHKP